MTMYNLIVVINKIIFGVVAWMGFGLIIVLSAGFPFYFYYPRTLASWILWCAAAPLLVMLAGGVIVLIERMVPKAWIEWVMRYTPIGWCLNWIRTGEDAIDRMLRVGAVALAFLVVFLVALRLIFGPA